MSYDLVETLVERRLLLLLSAVQGPQAQHEAFIALLHQLVGLASHQESGHVTLNPMAFVKICIDLLGLERNLQSSHW